MREGRPRPYGYGRETGPPLLGGRPSAAQGLDRGLQPPAEVSVRLAEVAAPDQRRT
ncbi:MULTISPECIES: hypothetical protein [unclassified Streptomyces]|uniref:hypothetical protein n=1 Tax=unclassified Streptomyces TaxID=2593676 RepID=UPI00380A7F7F